MLSFVSREAFGTHDRQFSTLRVSLNDQLWKTGKTTREKNFFAKYKWTFQPVEHGQKTLLTTLGFLVYLFFYLLFQFVFSKMELKER